MLKSDSGAVSWILSIIENPVFLLLIYFVEYFLCFSTMKANTLALFEVFKKTMSDEDARLVVRYMEDANEAEIIKAVERKIEHLSTKEDLANTKSDIIKWMFIFWVAQLGAMFGFLYFFLTK